MTKAQQLASKRNWKLCQLRGAKTALRNLMHPKDYESILVFLDATEEIIDEQWKKAKKLL